MPELIFTVEQLAAPPGALLIVTDQQQNVRAIDWVDYRTRMEMLLRRRYGAGGFTAVDTHRRSRPSRLIADYFEGDMAALAAVPTAMAGTEFQRQVWRALRRIPAGGTTSYSALAAALGRPNACRAVGLANGSNPICIAVPCHRVIGAGGALTGFAGGLDRKRWLLGHERRYAAKHAAAVELQLAS